MAPVPDRQRRQRQQQKQQQQRTTMVCQDKAAYAMAFATAFQAMAASS